MVVDIIFIPVKISIARKASLANMLSLLHGRAYLSEFF